MSKRTVLIGLGICVFLGLLGAGAWGWRWYKRYQQREWQASNHYRIAVKEGQVMDMLGKAEEDAMEMESVLKRVAEDLDLMKVWEMESESRVLERLREKLTVTSKITEYVRVSYQDREKERAAEILNAIIQNFMKERPARVRSGMLPALLPVEVDMQGVPVGPPQK